MWIKQVVSMASAERAFPPGCVREVGQEEGERLLDAGFAIPSEQPSEHSAVVAAEKAVAKRAEAKRRPPKK